MPYTPTDNEARRLRRAVELARFSEGERIFFLMAFIALVVFDVAIVAGAGTWAGALGSLGGFLILYWRLRGGHLAGKVAGDAGLFSLGLMRREQRAFTGLMLRQALTGRNALAPREEHDPLLAFEAVLEKMRSGQQAPSEEA